MKKNTREKIALKKQTVRTLVAAQLDAIAGGGINPTRSIVWDDTCA